MVSRLCRMVSESDRLEFRSRTACWASISPDVMSLTSFQNLTARSRRLRSHFSLSWACLWASSQRLVRLQTRSWIAGITKIIIDRPCLWYNSVYEMFYHIKLHVPEYVCDSCLRYLCQWNCPQEPLCWSGAPEPVSSHCWGPDPFLRAQTMCACCPVAAPEFVGWGLEEPLRPAGDYTGAPVSLQSESSSHSADMDIQSFRSELAFMQLKFGNVVFLYHFSNIKHMASLTTGYISVLHQWVAFL